MPSDIPWEHQPRIDAAHHDEVHAILAGEAVFDARLRPRRQRRLRRRGARRSATLLC